MDTDTTVQATTGAERNPVYPTREAWLNAAITRAFRPWFAELGLEIPAYQVAMGYGEAYRRGVLAQCYVRELSEGVSTLYVTPETVDAVDILDSVLHELIHAIDNCASGHRGFFVEIARKLGFIGPWTSTPLTDELRSLLERIASDLGPLPHAKVMSISKLRKSGPQGGMPETVALTPSGGVKVTAGPGQQKNRQVKAACPEHEDYFIRMSRGKAAKYGAPKCPLCDSQLELEEG